MRSPDFSNLLQVLDRKVPKRPTLFEFFLNDALNSHLAGETLTPDTPGQERDRIEMKAFAAAGYDYYTIKLHGFGYPCKQMPALGKTYSINDTTIISDRATFNAYPWQDPAKADLPRLKAGLARLPAGMKAILWGPGGVLENAISLVGYENLCFMVLEEPALAGDVFEAVGSSMLRYYEIAAGLPGIGACISNDDWGFNSQTMLSPADLRKYVFPWHKKIVHAVHAAGKPAILHSCGQLQPVMDDIIDDMQFDAKHSYEDKICPVEDMYEKYHSRIAILGGLDLDFVCRKTPAEIQTRAQAMLTRTATRGAYALGTGNSVPYYVPEENYRAMIAVVTGAAY